MRLAIMQPYFFPYLGHFSLIAAADEWIVFDISQYTPRSWMNRNRILHPAGGWKWITVPLANSSIHIRTEQAEILNPEAALRSILGHLTIYRRAPYYAPVRELVIECFGQDRDLTSLNVRGLAAVCRYVGLPFRHRVCSALSLDLPHQLGPGDWAPEICTRLGATSYVNPLGGRDLFDPSSFATRGVTLSFLEATPFTYSTPGFTFEPNLSILDALMWSPPEIVLAAIRTYELHLPGSELNRAA
jgi:hypothetical protein